MSILEHSCPHCHAEAGSGHAPSCPEAHVPVKRSEVDQMRTELVVRRAEVERLQDYYQTALTAWNKEIELRKQAEAKLEEARAALEEIRQWASGEREVGEGEDAETALILIDNCARAALSPAPEPEKGGGA